MASETPDPELQRAAPWRIGVDVGGTFTDMVFADRNGSVSVFKVPSVTDDPSAGVLAALKRAAAGFSMSVPDLLEGCGLFVHGSTVATNIMLEHKGAKVGLLATEGFRDSLEIRRGIREDQWDHRRPFAPVLVPRYLRRPVRGRIDRDGAELAPLERSDVEAALRRFADEGVESVAVALINSFLNPAHEAACAEIARETGQFEWLSLSSEVAPVMGEYERTSTAVVNAYLAPKTVSYLRALDQQLKDLGLGRPLLMVQSNGGMVSVDQLESRPVNLVLSGPAAGVGALNLYARTAGTDNLIAMEIGGTSCDVTLMAEGTVAVTDDLMIAGYQLATPSVEIHTVGAGGGAIAGVDEAGMLFVGPHGAGARPGPACYGFGGTEPTVTDAQLVLGRLRPGPYADGSVSLDDALAREAIDRAIAAPLGLETEAAAAGIIRLIEQNLMHAVDRISTDRGYNPARFVLVAAGGAGPMHGASVGRALGFPRVYIPRQAGAFCAVGMLHSDLRHDFMQVFFGQLGEVDESQLASAFESLEARARSTLAAEGFEAGQRKLERGFDLRYRGQQWSIRVALDGAAGMAADAVRTSFEAEHQRLFGHIQPDGVIEITSLRVIGKGLIEPLHFAAAESSDTAPEPSEHRPVYLDERHGRQSVAVYAGGELRPGHRLPGPLLVEEPTTTVVVGPDDVLEIDAAGNHVIHLQPNGGRRGA